MILKSKLKTVFSVETLDTLAKLCDTMRIPSVIKKMEFAQQIIKRNHPDLQFSILGGATNRLVLFIDGVPFKFAMDNQGYIDNLIEYSLGNELQPYVPKPFETNGYVLVCEPWRALTLDEFTTRKQDIISVLETLSQDYLLGDVGYLKKNYTNWGVNDKGRVGILDYAYVHRATENLFVCEVCGQGILRYDSSYSRLKCSNATVCNASYTYLERKTMQGNQVDLEMIDEAKSASIVLKGDKTFVDVIDNDGELISGNKKIIKTREEYLNYLKEEQNMSNYDNVQALDLLIAKLDAETPEEIAEIDKKLNELAKESEAMNRCSEDDEDVEYIIEYDPALEDEDEEEDIETYDDDDDNPDINYTVSVSDLIDRMQGRLTRTIGEEIHCTVGGRGNKFCLKADTVGVALEEPIYHEGIVVGGKSDEDNSDSVDDINEDVIEDNAIDSNDNDEIVEVGTDEVFDAEPISEPTDEEEIDEECCDETSESKSQFNDFSGIILDGKPVREQA